MCIVGTEGGESRNWKVGRIMTKVEDRQAVRILKKGGVVCFPTDTVWGVGAAVSSVTGIEKLYRVKKRAQDKPTAILVNSFHMAKKYGKFDDRSWNLAVKYWPGGVTIVVPVRKGRVPRLILGGVDKVGLRIPDNELTLNLLDKLGEGMVTASANFAGEKAPVQEEDLSADLLGLVDARYGGGAGSGVSSTVIDTTAKGLDVLREGSVKIPYKK